ncbi:hypothetical protein NDU88_003323 [Pleurodeles waltl]|uniref:Myb/SANT-like DNA-binding domain-containing protein n=1 Tax=Pleurodeles waltl TaxID=8319 RepID=A0AAV7T4X6_PLEWA|nr:hypothetical protein NDU88_003323 [Pleurodeles waltl]
MGAYHHSQETMAMVLAKFQETQRLQDEQQFGFREELKSINSTLATIVVVLKELVNTRRDTVAQQRTPDIGLDDELPTTSAGASGQEVPPQDRNTSTPTPADGEPPREDLHCKCCCDLSLEETMARESGERAPAFSTEELEKLVDGDLPQYTLLYCPPDKQVSAHQKKDIWRAITKEVRTLGVNHRRITHCRKRWEDICRWRKKTAEDQLGMASQRGRGARLTMTPLMFRILAVAFPDLDGHLRASQKPQGGSVLTVVFATGVRAPGRGAGR